MSFNNTSEERDLHVFPISAAYFPNIYSAYTNSFVNYRGPKGPKSEVKNYGLSFILEEAPAAIIQYLPPHENNLGTGGRPDKPYTRVNYQHAPMVVVDDEHQIGFVQATVFRLADDFNIRRDSLLFMCPMELAVELVPVRDNIITEDRAPTYSERCGVRALLRAIRVKNDDLIKAYDRECARWFTGA